MYDKNVSPVGWYIGTYLLRFTEVGYKKNNSPEERFTSWENTVIVKAKDMNEAYAKIAKIGKSHTKPYKGGPNGIPVQWMFEGLTELLPIYDALEDGAEVIWAEHGPRKLKNLKKIVRARDEFKQ
jgi:hypothetical protein